MYSLIVIKLHAWRCRVDIGEDGGGVWDQWWIVGGRGRKAVIGDFGTVKSWECVRPIIDLEVVMEGVLEVIMEGLIFGIMDCLPSTLSTKQMLLQIKIRIAKPPQNLLTWDGISQPTISWLWI